MRRLTVGSVGGAGVVALCAAFVLAGCGGARTVTVTVPATTTDAAARVPPAPVGRGVPGGYRATHVWRVDLTGDSVPEVVVASVGPPVTASSFHSADLRVLAWDRLVRRWGVAFDAQKVVPPATYGKPRNSNTGPGYYTDVPAGQQQVPLLDPKADVRLGPVRFGALLPGGRKQLVFSAVAGYGGSGAFGTLAVVDFEGGIANLVYAWGGEGLTAWKLARGRLRARAAYWTPADPHCCPLRDYTFTVASQRGRLTETSDDRPWLGVTVRKLEGPAGVAGPLRVIRLDDDAARGSLHVGDVLLKVLNAPALRENVDPAALSSIFDRLNLLHAGQVAKLLVWRGSARITVTVRLGSLKDCHGVPLPGNDYTVDAL